MGSVTGWRADLARVTAVARRDFAVERSYSLRFLLRLVRTVITILVVYQTSQLIVDAPELAEWGGDYFDFAMVGLATLAVAQLGTSAFNRALHGEMSAGTLEVLLATPTPTWTLLAGAVLFPALITAVELTWYLGLGLGLLGNGWALDDMVVAGAAIMLTFGSYCAFGIVGAAIVLLTKRGDPVTMVVGLATAVLAGAIVPIATFPGVIQGLARVFPAYYGIRGARLALLTNAPFSEIAPSLALLLVVDVFLFAVAILIFRRAVDRARAAGTLGSY